MALGGRGSTAGTLALAALREHDVAWRLLRSDHAEVVAGVLGARLSGEVRRLGSEELTELVAADLDELRAAGLDLPRAAPAYLAEWRAAGYLVRRPTEDARGETLELAPAALEAIRVLHDLAVPRQSVTESRLAGITAQLRRLAVEVDPDTSRRIRTLREQRDQIDARIDRIEAGDLEQADPARIVEQVRDVLQQAEQMPSDFARVRARFEELNRGLRERIVESDLGDAHVLAEVFRGVDLIGESEEGRSFEAFSTLLTDTALGSAFDDDVELVLDHAATHALTAAERRFLRRFLGTLKEHSGEIQDVVTDFARGLRRYVQSQEYQRERVLRRELREALAAAVPVSQVIKPFSQSGVELALTALTVRSAGVVGLHDPSELDATAPVERHEAEAVDLAALRAVARETEIDWAELADAVASALAALPEASVGDVLALHPATQGVASVVGLVALAADHGVRGHGSEEVRWVGLDRVQRVARIPRRAFRERVP